MAYHALVFCVHVHTIADKYMVDGLAILAVQKFKAWAGEGYEWRVSDLKTAIEQMYTNGPEAKISLRRCAIQIAAKDSREIYKNDDAAITYRRLVASNSAFAAEMLEEVCLVVLPQRLPKLRRYACPGYGCGETIAM